MDKLLDEDDIFLLLLFEEEHRATCLQAIALGKRLSLSMFEEIVEREPRLLLDIFDNEFVIASEWNYVNECFTDDSQEIYNLFEYYFGKTDWFNIVLGYPTLHEHFLKFFFSDDTDEEDDEESNFQDTELMDKLFQYAKSLLAARRIDELMALFDNCPALQIAIRKNHDADFRDKLFDVLKIYALQHGDESDLLYVFDLQYCLDRGIDSLLFLECAFWEYDEDYFWSLLRLYPEMLNTIGTTTDNAILQSMVEHDVY